MDHATTSFGYNRETPPGLIFPTQVEGTVPLYRAYQPQGHDHFYTADKAEMDHAISAWRYEAEGIAGYLYPMSQCGTIPLYRTYLLRPGRITNHFYTSSVVERDNAIKNYGYKDEGISGYVLPL